MDADIIMRNVENLISEYMVNGVVKSYSYNNVRNMLQEYFSEFCKKYPEINNEITPQNCWLAHELDQDRFFQAPGKSRYGNASDILNDIEMSLVN